MTIRHTYRGDLVIDLVGPTGQAVLGLKVDSAAADNADDVVGTYQVDGSSQPANGTWRLVVRDIISGDSGYIDQWSLTLPSYKEATKRPAVTTPPVGAVPRTPRTRSDGLMITRGARGGRDRRGDPPRNGPPRDRSSDAAGGRRLAEG